MPNNTKYLPPLPLLNQITDMKKRIAEKRKALQPDYADSLRKKEYEALTGNASALEGIAAIAKAKQAPSAPTEKTLAATRYFSGQWNPEHPLYGTTIPYGKSAAAADSVTIGIPSEKKVSPEDALKIREADIVQRYLGGDRDFTPQEQAVIYDRYPSTKPKEPKETQTETIAAAQNRIAQDIYKNKKLLDQTDPANKGKNPLSGLSIMTSSGEIPLGGGNVVDIGPEARNALESTVQAKQDTLAMLTAPAVKRFGIQTYDEMFAYKSALENTIVQYNTIKDTQGVDAADSYLEQSVAPGTTIGEVIYNYQLFQPQTAQPESSGVAEPETTYDRIMRRQRNQ